MTIRVPKAPGKRDCAPPGQGAPAEPLGPKGPGWRERYIDPNNNFPTPVITGLDPVVAPFPTPVITGLDPVVAPFPTPVITGLDPVISCGQMTGSSPVMTSLVDTTAPFPLLNRSIRKPN
jgi:hypothetical protein